MSEAISVVFENGCQEYVDKSIMFFLLFLKIR
jgi:hypothetical protein